MHNLGTSSVKKNHKQTRTYKTHHGLDLGEATTFPLIVYFVPLHEAHIQMAFCFKTPKQESQNSQIVTTLALSSRPRQRLARAQAKRNVRECEDEDSHSQASSHFGSWSPDGLPNLQRVIIEVKTPRIEEFFI
jgi:hypothetical protein